MITLDLKIGNSTLTGLTFSVFDTRADKVEILISNLGSVTNQFITMAYENELEQNVLTGTMAEDLTASPTLELQLKATSTTDIDYFENLHMGIKGVTVELIP